MNSCPFIWDEAGNASNIKKHGVSFEESTGIFSDDNALYKCDTDCSRHEDMFIIMGASGSSSRFIVCSCYKENGALIRILSARTAKDSETEEYKRGLI